MWEDLWAFGQENAGLILTTLLILGLLWRPIRDRIRAVMGFLKDYHEIRDAVLATKPNGGGTDNIGDRVVRVERQLQTVSDRQERIIAKVDSQTESIHKVAESMSFLSGELSSLFRGQLIQRRPHFIDFQDDEWGGSE